MNLQAKDMPAFSPEKIASIGVRSIDLSEEVPWVCHISAHIKNDNGANSVASHQHGAHARM
jgi:hypothetical protein